MHTAIWHHRRPYTYNIYRNVASCEAIMMHVSYHPFLSPTVSQINEERTKNHTHNLCVLCESAKYCRSQSTIQTKMKSFQLRRRVWVESVVVLTSKRHRQSPIVAVNVYAPSLINVIDSTRARRRRVLYLPASPLHIVPASWMQRT